MAAATEADICNLALYDIGQGVTVANPLSGDTTAAGAVCRLVYPQVRDALLKRFPWTFAKKQVPLQQIVESAGSGLDLSDFLYAYQLPTDFLQARYIWDGARPGSPVSTWIQDPDLMPPDSVSVMPAIDGQAVAVPFEVVGSVLYADWYTALPAWDATLGYSPGYLVTYGGFSFVCLLTTTPGQAPGANGQGTAYWGAASVTRKVDLVYTAQITDVTKFTAEFVDAVAAKLSARLARSQAAKPDLAAKLDAYAEQLVVRAAAIASNGREPDRVPDSSFVSVRG